MQHTTNEQMAKVMGWERIGRSYFYFENGKAIEQINVIDWIPCDDLYDAFTVVEKLRSRGWYINIEIDEKRYIVSLGRLANLHTVAVAKICRALDELPQTICNAIQHGIMESEAYGS